ncbi:hypothetical protein [Nocardia salmonicida]|uniref:hypothetical protein n=1 Tax=Nocardia salmonicida TaxID=53431 RepID=UPI0007A3CC73|nr:hypothetical protein [Nocardia salmonicida]
MLSGWSPHEAISFRQRYLAPIAVSVVLGGVTGCGSAESPATISASAAPTSGLGTPFAFTDASNGANVRTITFTEIALAPAECLTELLPGRVALAVRSQVESIGTSRMSQPDQWPLSTVDRAGITQLDRARHSLCLGQGPDSNVWTVLNTRVTRMLGATILLDFRVTLAAIAFHPHGFRP